MGRPRQNSSGTYVRVVTDLPSDTEKALREVCQREHVSKRKLLRALVEGYLSGPAYRVKYRDPLVFENVSNPGEYSLAVRECLGWVDRDSDDPIRIVWDRSVNPGPGEKDPAGSSGLVLPKNAIVELRRLTSS